MCMTLFCLIMVWHGFLSCRKKIFTEASATFQDAISKEMNTRLGSIPIKTNRGTLLLSDSISYEEKERWCDQDYLSLNDPNRIFLDSLFRARLADLGMETQTAVRCKRKEKTTISYTDSLFMKKATALKPVIYRKNKNIEDNITSICANSAFLYFKTGRFHPSLFTLLWFICRNFIRQL